MGDSRDASSGQLVTRTFSPLLDDSVVHQATGQLEREDVGASITRNTVGTVCRDPVVGYGGMRQMRTPDHYFITVTGAARDPRG